MADRCGPWTAGVTAAGGLDRFLGSGMRKVAEGGEGHSAGLDVPSHRAPRGPCPGEASCAWSTTLRRSRALDALCFAVSGPRPRGEGRLQEPYLKLCLACDCGSRPGAVALDALGDREAGQDHLSEPPGWGWGAAFTCACSGRGPRLGRRLSLEVLGCCTESPTTKCLGQSPTCRVSLKHPKS